MFAKEHIQGLLHPLAQHRFLFGNEKRLDSDSIRRWDLPPLGQTDGLSHHNDTVLSAAELVKWTPIFLIRHPALSFPFFYRIFS